MRLTQKVGTEVHWLPTLIAALGLVPAFLLLHLPFRFAWGHFFSTYWIGLTLQSVPVAVVLYLVGFPRLQTVRPLWEHYRAQKPRIVFLALFIALMAWESGPVTAAILIVVTVAMLEVVDRTKGDYRVLFKWVSDVAVPAAYLFVGLVLVFAYNDIIAAVTYTGACDRAFLKMDSVILLGRSVSGISHIALARLGSPVFTVSEFVYYRMFAQIGAGLAITALSLGRREALRYVGTLLTAYYFALIIFSIWPSMGPFFTCPVHFSEFPHSLMTYAAQSHFLAKARLLWNHGRIDQIGTDFYVAFPCMHIAQPLVVLWFLRRWKRMVLCLVIYDVLLIPAILLLEWHYVVDLFGGVAVAALAIAVNYGWKKQEGLERAGLLALLPATPSFLPRDR